MPWRTSWPGLPGHGRLGDRLAAKLDRQSPVLRAIGDVSFPAAIAVCLAKVCALPVPTSVPDNPNSLNAMGTSQQVLLSILGL